MQASLVRPAVNDPGDAQAALAGWLAQRAEEAAIILFLDGNRHVTGHLLCPGTIDRVDLPLRAIVRDALALDCAGVLLGHNHPKGDPSPSSQDIEATRRLHNVVRMIGIDLVDHCIVSGDRLFSFRGHGLM